jgi:hypothetical protein
MNKRKEGYSIQSRCLATIGRIQTYRLTGGIYEERLSDGLRCHDVHTKFHKFWSRLSKFVGRGGMHRHREHGHRISLLQENTLKNKNRTRSNFQGDDFNVMENLALTRLF